jgi:sterol desaturase/sphingolipid hydroxylase (fatty acid hydroxylase superfamily)
MFGQVVDIACVVLLAPPLAGVVVAGLLATLFTNLQHANADLPATWERLLRPWILTPANHRTHHSALMADQMSNFGELVPWWDQLAGTYRARPERGEADLQVGMEGYRDEAANEFFALLTQPFEEDRQPAGSGLEAEAGKVVS